MKCVCESGLEQMYLAQCKDYIKRVSAVMPLQLVANDGTVNAISLSTIPVPESVFLNLFNDSNATKRMHYLAGIKNFAGTPAEPTLQSWDDGTTTELANGQLSVAFVIPETSPMAQYAMQSLHCANPGTFFKTEAGQIIGYANPETIATDKKLYPIPVERWQVVANPFTSSTEVAMVTVTIFFPISLDLGRFTIMNQDEYVMIPNRNYEARKAIISNGTAPATVTSANVVVSRASGGILGNTAPVSGLLFSDFDVLNATTLAPVVVLTAVEAPAGNYVLTFATQVSADVLKVNLNSGSGSVSNTATVTIP